MKSKEEVYRIQGALNCLAEADDIYGFADLRLYNLSQISDTDEYDKLHKEFCEARVAMAKVTFALCKIRDNLKQQEEA